MSSFEPCRFNTYFHAICATAIALAFVVSGQTVLAVDGDLDPTFGTDGKVLTDFDHSTDIAYAVAVQTDGKLVVVGTTYRDNDFSNERSEERRVGKECRSRRYQDQIKKKRQSK